MDGLSVNGMGMAPTLAFRLTGCGLSVKGKLAALVPSGPSTLGWWCARVVEGQGELLAGSRAVLGRYVVMSSGVVKPCLMSQL